MSDEIKSQIVSPEVNGDRVTFRIRAPGAKQVLIDGIPEHPAFPLTQAADGLWTGTLEGLTPEIYGYHVLVDGTRMADPSNRDVKKWLTCDSQFEVSGGLLHESNEVPHGDLHEIHYRSPVAGRQRRALVYLPPGDVAIQRASVLVLLHGYGDDHLAWKEVGRANYILDNLIAQNRIKPCVVVMPDGHPVPIDLSVDFEDYAAGNLRPMEQDLIDGLLPVILQRYPVSGDRQDWALAGLSMGGGQAIEIGLRHRDLFSRVGGFSSAAPHGEFEMLDRWIPDLIEDADQTNQQLDLFWLACGQDDFLLPRNNHFAAWLSERGIDHEYEVTAGGHDWQVWRKYLADFVQAAFPPEA